MGLFDRKPQASSHAAHGSMRASGQRVTKRESDALRRLIQPWQSRSLTYYDIVPEIKYAAQFYSRALSLLRLYVGEKDEAGEIQESENPDVIAQLDRIKDPGGGGRTQLQAQYGRLRFLTGEGYLTCTLDPDTEIEQWEMLSSDELRVNGSGNYTRYKAPSLAAENYEDPPDESYEVLAGEAVVYRLWNRHPRYSALADSTMQGVLDVCEELVLLTQAVRARARSRLASSGILIVNGQVFPAPPIPVPDEDPQEDVFLRDLVYTMTQPISDEGSASAVVPLVVRADVDNLDNVMKHLQIVDPTQLYPETGLRTECVNRLAIGLDMPPEILKGMADANHWTGWMIDDQTWKAHLQPVAEQLVSDLTSSFFQPTLKAAGMEDWDRYVIDYDEAEIVVSPDKSKNAKDLHDRIVISDEAYREVTGFAEEDAVTDTDEMNRRMGIALRDASLAVYGEPSVRTGGVMTSEDDILSPAESNSNAATNDAGTPGGVEKGPPASDNGNGPAAEAVVAAAVAEAAESDVMWARILGASDLALHRARELAGSRIRTKARRDTATRNLVADIRNPSLAAVLGTDEVRRLTKMTEVQLVAGAAESFAETFKLWGLDSELAVPLGKMIEQHAAKSLYDAHPAPLPSTFENYVRGITLTADSPAGLVA